MTLTVLSIKYTLQHSVCANFTSQICTAITNISLLQFFKRGYFLNVSRLELSSIFAWNMHVQHCISIFPRNPIHLVINVIKVIKPKTRPSFFTYSLHFNMCNSLIAFTGWWHSLSHSQLYHTLIEWSLPFTNNKLPGAISQKCQSYHTFEAKIVSNDTCHFWIYSLYCLSLSTQVD